MEIERQEFTEWLGSFDGDTIIGHPNSTVLCPVARFLSIKNPGASITVIADKYVINGQGFKPKRWTSTFIRRCDRKYLGRGKITARQALTVLGKVG